MRSGSDLPRSRPYPLLDRGSPIPLLRRRHTSSDRRRLHNDSLLSAILHLLAVHARRKTAVVRAGPDLVAPLVVHVFDVEGVDVAGEVAVGFVSMLSVRVGRGTYPRIVRRMLMSKSAPQPATRKTPTGGTTVC